MKPLKPWNKTKSHHINSLCEYEWIRFKYSEVNWFSMLYGKTLLKRSIETFATHFIFPSKCNKFS